MKSSSALWFEGYGVALVMLRLFNLAAEAQFQIGAVSPLQIFDTNEDCSVRCAEAAKPWPQ
jgi:hypothetical protein